MSASNLNKLQNSTALLTGLSIVSCLVAFISKGTIPDTLTLITTTSLGGYLGVTIPTATK